MGSKITPDWDIRDAIVDAGAQDAYKCYQCGKCMAVCPWCHVNAVTFPVYRVPQAVKLGAIMASEDTADIEREVTEVVGIVTSSATELQSTAESMAATAEETSRQSEAVAAAAEQATSNVQTVAAADAAWRTGHEGLVR